jgi:hypothetical protein
VRSYVPTLVGATQRLVVPRVLGSSETFRRATVVVFVTVRCSVHKERLVHLGRRWEDERRYGRSPAAAWQRVGVGPPLVDDLRPTASRRFISTRSTPPVLGFDAELDMSVGGRGHGRSGSIAASSPERRSERGSIAVANPEARCYTCQK